MSTCTKWVDQAVLQCKNFAEKIDYECTQWADEGSQKCSEWADEGYNECSEWGKKCHWYTFWNCVVEWFCKGWYWVSKWVCKGWYWVSKWVCKALAWIIKTICVTWGWINRLVCVAWDTVTCLLRELGSFIAGLFSKTKKPAPKIEHVFVLMLENRSFDHMLGLSNIRGTDAKTGLPTTINGVDTNTHFNSDKEENKYYVAPNAEFSLKDIDKDPGHEFENILTQLCGINPVTGEEYKYPLKDEITGDIIGNGYPLINNSGFVIDYIDRGCNSPDRVMKCFSERQLPVINQLAREFAICDNWFSSLPAPTFPNRLFIHAASSAGMDDSPKALNLLDSGIEIPSEVKDAFLDGYRFENGNIFDALDAKCIKWEIFEGDELPVSFLLSGMNLNALQGRFTDFEHFEEKVSKIDYDKKFIFIEPNYGNLMPWTDADYTCGNSMHPVDDVASGEKLIKKTYEVIRNSPHWEKSILLVVFDEHGGFYDHVPPPTTVSPEDLKNEGFNYHNFAFDQLGPRVPAIVISPLIKKNTIDHTIYDHTSLLATLERLMGIKPLTNRDKQANDFLHLFSLESARQDTPSILHEVADSGFHCEDDKLVADPQEKLIRMRAELIDIKKTGELKQLSKKIEVSENQPGFNYIALMKVLLTAKYPDRQQWIENYKNIKTDIDATLFMIEAKLKLKHGIDFNEINRVSATYRKKISR